MATLENAPHIFFEDTHLVVLSKPAGLLSQGEISGDENLVDWLRAHFGRHYVGLIHRLDRNTSGIMVVAKRTKSAQRLTQALQEGRIERSYLAWVEGRLSAPVRWKHRLLKDAAKNRVRVLPLASREGQLAELTASPLAFGEFRGAPLTLLELKLETGRSHQIRVQASHEGLPLLGDVKYGSAQAGFGRPALHSSRLVFPHPMSGETLDYLAPLPADMSAIAQRSLSSTQPLR